MTALRNDPLIEDALASATDTRCLQIGRGILGNTAEVFQSLFGSASAIIVADENTFRVAGKKVYDALRAAGQKCEEPFLFTDPDLYAEYKYVEELERVIAKTEAIPVAVGSGAINDLTKLVANHCLRQYMCVATAASMDGYTAYGASITYKGSKQTFNCPAPLAVIADLDVIAAAPVAMNASGYADLLAKVPAGADWIVADALAIEPIDAKGWKMVQGRLREWLSDPEGVRQAKPEPLESLVAGLMMGGFAMQHCQTSRPASGAEHQFSHLWDMQHHTNNGQSVSHGFKVGIGTLASVAMYEYILEQPLADLDIAATVAQWPELPEIEASIRALYDEDEVRDKALEEVRAKHSSRQQLEAELRILKTNWPKLKASLTTHLPSRRELQDKLAIVGAPSTPPEIGISHDRLRTSYYQAWHIRRRYTILDLAGRTASFDPCMQSVFGADGLWPA